MSILAVGTRLAVEVEDAVEIEGNVLYSAVRQDAENYCADADSLGNFIFVFKIRALFFYNFSSFL